VRAIDLVEAIEGHAVNVLSRACGSQIGNGSGGLERGVVRALRDSADGSESVERSAPARLARVR